MLKNLELQDTSWSGKARHVLRAWRAQQSALVDGGLWLLAFAVLCFVGMAIDDREVLGLNVWVKPQKFATSIAIFVFTMAWVVSVHRVPRTMCKVIVWTLLVTIVLEQGLITMQAARGERSHFNFTSKFNIAVYSLMGFMVAVATIASVAAMVMPLRGDTDPQPLHFRARRWTRVGLRVGEVCFVVGCGFAAWLASGKGHIIGAGGAVADGGPGLPYLNWSTTHFDGRVPHFVLLHALQVGPLVGALVDAAGKRTLERDAAAMLR